EREEAMPAEACEDLLERLGVELELAELAAADAASRVLSSGIDAHQAEKHLAAGCLRARVEASIELLRAAAECADHAACRKVAVEREQVARACGEELGECVLQQGKCPRLITDIGNNLRDEARFEADADAFRRPLDRLCELVLGRGGDGDHARAQQLAELRVSEWMVEEVRAQSDDDAHRRTPITRKRNQPVEEPPSRLLVRGEREQL